MSAFKSLMAVISDTPYIFVMAVTLVLSPGQALRYFTRLNCLWF